MYRVITIISLCIYIYIYMCIYIYIHNNTTTTTNNNNTNHNNNTNNNVIVDAVAIIRSRRLSCQRSQRMIILRILLFVCLTPGVFH